MPRWRWMDGCRVGRATTMPWRRACVTANASAIRHHFGRLIRGAGRHGLAVRVAKRPAAAAVGRAHGDGVPGDPRRASMDSSKSSIYASQDVVVLLSVTKHMCDLPCLVCCLRVYSLQGERLDTHPSLCSIPGHPPGAWCMVHRARSSSPV
jgi:hypothetical protein